MGRPQKAGKKIMPAMARFTQAEIRIGCALPVNALIG
jgi:hypothetical protein